MDYSRYGGGTLLSLVENTGLLCLAIQNGANNEVGRTKLQKMIYFANRYLAWGDINDFKLHFYGPYSRNLAKTIRTARNSELINEKSHAIGPYEYDLTADGSKFLKGFIENVCDKTKTENTQKSFQELSTWSKDELELAATLDFVNMNTPGIKETALIDKVSIIKDNFSREYIESSYAKLQSWKEEHNLKN